MKLLLCALIFVTDAVTAYMAGRYLDARSQRRLGPTVAWDIALETVLGINLLGFIAVGLWALPASVAGSALGTAASFLHDRRRA